MSNPSQPPPVPPVPEEPENAPPAEVRGPKSRPRVVHLLAGAAMLSTTVLLPVIEPKNPPFRAD